MSVENRMKVLLGEAAEPELAKTVDAMRKYIALAESFAQYHNELAKQTQEAVYTLDRTISGMGKKLMAKPDDKYSSVLAAPWNGLEDLRSEMSDSIRALESRASLDPAEEQALEVLYNASWVDDSRTAQAYRQLSEAIRPMEEALQAFRFAVVPRGALTRSIESLKKSLKELENAAK